ncbi:MAG: GNAT family N-acetyltransferase [Anaerolineae bacterium]|nr:GNAT family N-acetyltransferase [Phycisphaerae bacterium]
MQLRLFRDSHAVTIIAAIHMRDEQPTIRPATNDDAPALRELIFTILREFNLPPDPDNTDADLNDIESSYFERGGRFDVLVDGSGEIIGSVGLHRVDEGMIELRKMYLRSNERGKGLGTRLLDHALTEARRMGCRRMTLETASQLKTAIGMYTRAGFRPMCGTIHTKRCDQAYEMEL